MAMKPHQPMGLKFENLPLTEVCLRLAPSTPLPMDPVGMAHLVSAKPPDFRARHLTKPYDGFGRACLPIAGDVYGLEFNRDDKSTVVVFQSNLLQVFWRNYNLRSDFRYPGFESLSAILRDMVGAVKELWDGDADPLPHFFSSNIRYTNFVGTDGPPVGADLYRYIGKKYLPNYANQQIVHELESCWKEDDPNETDVRLHFQVAATREHDFGFEIATSAGHFFSEKYCPLSEIKEDHDYLQGFFKGILTKRALKEWGFDDVTQI